jgi:hypothetical protein
LPTEGWKTYLESLISDIRTPAVVINLSCTSLIPIPYLKPIHPSSFNSNQQLPSKMKLFLQGTTILGLLIANASAAKSGLFAANGVELEMYQSGEEIIYGEPVSP